jgi:hypothetical protein
LRPQSRDTVPYKLEANAYRRFADLTLTREILIDRFGKRPLDWDDVAALVRKPDDTAILAFANSHGLLGIDTAGEPVAVWRKAVGEMVTTLDALEHNAVEAADVISGKDSARRLRDKLRDTVNRHLIGAALQVAGDPPDFHKQIVPRDLLTALWAQLVESLTTGHILRACVACGTWMEVTPEGTGHRFNQRVCSVPCRMTVYNRIKRAAVAMRSEGQSLKVIARRLKTEHGWQPADKPEQQIKKWIGEK